MGQLATRRRHFGETVRNDLPQEAARKKKAPGSHGSQGGGGLAFISGSDWSVGQRRILLVVLPGRVPLGFEAYAGFRANVLLRGPQSVRSTTPMQTLPRGCLLDCLPQQAGESRNSFDFPVSLRRVRLNDEAGRYAIHWEGSRPF